MKSLVKAASLAIVLSSAMIGAPAFAAGGTATTLSVTSNVPSVVTGHHVGFRATVAPSRVGAMKLSGTVAWTITGHDGSTVACGITTGLTKGGTANCMVDPAQLLAAASPYTVTATYSGDANFASSTGSTTETVTPAVTRLKIVLSANPTSGASTVIQAIVHGGPGSAALAGNVTFAAVASSATKGVKPFCSVVGKPPSPADNSQPLVDGIATCTLPAGWFMVPVASSSNKHPHSTWAIAATYDGNGSFDPVTNVKMGVSRF